MNYRPSATLIVEQWISGVCSQSEEMNTGVHSPSLHVYDRRVLIRHCRDVVDGRSVGDVVLEYPSQSFILLQDGHPYLFAFSQEDCLGFVEMPDAEHVRLPDGTIEVLAEYTRKNLRRPFPDYFGTFENR